MTIPQELADLTDPEANALGTLFAEVRDLEATAGRHRVAAAWSYWLVELSQARQDLHAVIWRMEDDLDDPVPPPDVTPGDYSV